MNCKKALLLFFLTIFVAACEDPVIFYPQDNTRVDINAGGDWHNMHIAVNEDQHQQLLMLGDINQGLVLEMYDEANNGWYPQAIYSNQYSEIYGGFYEWSFQFYIAPWMWFTEPNTWGNSMKLRLSYINENGEMIAVKGISVSPYICVSQMIPFNSSRNECHYVDEIAVRQKGSYIPNVTQGKVNYTSADVNSFSGNCVNNTIQQLSAVQDTGLDIERADYKYQFQDPVNGLFGFHAHVQGIGRLRDVEIDGEYKGRMVLTENADAGFHVAFQEIVGSNEAILSDEVHINDRIELDIRNEEQWGFHDHPGGLQAQGDVVVIAMEKFIEVNCWGKLGDPRLCDPDDHHAAVYFLRVNEDEIEFLHSFSLDGSQGEPHQADQNSAATAGFVQLDSGYFLLAVSGKKHGTQGIWFYESSETAITSATTWNYIDFYDPKTPGNCLGYGTSYDNCYVGAGGGLNLVTDCNGDVFLLAMHGSHGRRRQDEYEWLQVFRIEQNTNTGKIHLNKVHQQRDNLGRRSTNNRSFRWSGGAYVLNDGRLAVFNSERHGRLGDKGRVDGSIYMAKEHIRILK